MILYFIYRSKNPIENPAVYMFAQFSNVWACPAWTGEPIRSIKTETVENDGALISFVEK